MRIPIITLVTCLAAGATGCHERMDQLSPEELRHREFVNAERASCVDRLVRIRTELAALGAHPWAGEYSWRHDTECGNARFGETLVLAPRSGAVWWSWGDDPESASDVDHGDIASVDPDHIDVRWTVAARSPHPAGTQGRAERLSVELLRVEWDDRELLVPSSLMAEFCSLVRVSRNTWGVQVPRRNGWVTNYRDENIPSDMRGMPDVPDAWRSFLALAPIHATATVVADPHVVATNGPWYPWHTPKGFDWRWTVQIPHGERDGIRQGMLFWIEDAARIGLTLRSERVGSVVRTEPNAAWIELSGYSSSVDDLPRPSSTVRMSSVP